MTLSVFYTMSKKNFVCLFCTRWGPHLPLHAADPDQLVQDQQRTVDPVVTVHPFFFGQTLIKTLLSLLKGLLMDNTDVKNIKNQQSMQCRSSLSLISAQALWAV